MSKTSLKQRLFLLIFGIILTLILLEIGLRMAGAFVLFLQEKHNHLSSAQNNYRILCLGESTTALGGVDSYPSQLEGMLNEQSKRTRFTVINKGIISTTTNYILAHTDENLDRYKPQMVILMMGINDYTDPRPSKMPLWLWKLKEYFQDFRIYKLGHLLYKHISHRINDKGGSSVKIDEDEQTKKHAPKEDVMKELIALETQVLEKHLAAAKDYELKKQTQAAEGEYQIVHKTAITIGASFADLANRYIRQGQLDQAQVYLDRANEFIPDNLDLVEYWGEFYLAKYQGQQASEVFKKILTQDAGNQKAMVGLARAYYQLQSDEAFLIYAAYLKLNPRDYWGYIELAGWLKEKKHFNQALEYLQQASSVEPGLERSYLDIGQIYQEQGQYKQEEDLYLKLFVDKSNKAVFAQAIAGLYKKEGKEDLAKEYYKKALKMGMQQYSPWTLSNYDEILNKILSRGIKVIIMQYPIRSIDSLKDSVGNRSGVFFVENRLNFKKALESGRFDDYFSDHFAYDFGHCTRLGNQLIARNLTPVILEIAQ